MTEDTFVSVDNHSEVLLALLFELQNSLYKISRTSELGDPSYFNAISKESEVALRMINSLLDCIKLEGKQTNLFVEPVGLGSLLHEVAYEVKKYSDKSVDIKIKCSDPIMSNSELVKSLIFSLGYYLSSIEKSKKIVFSSIKSSKNKLKLVISTDKFDMSQQKLEKILNNNYSLHKPEPKVTNQSALLLLIASKIANAMGSNLIVKKLNGKKGISIEFDKSNQLSLI